MCWSGEASAVLATAGLVAAVRIARQGESSELWIPLGYFVGMEILQAATYVYIDECGDPMNRFLTTLGYLHIAFQPFFANMVAMYFVPEHVKRRIRPTVYGLCALSSVVILLKLFPFAWAGTCTVGVEGFCGPIACSMSGAWHIAWQLPLNGMRTGFVGSLLGTGHGLHALAYYLAVFAMPVVYGSWRMPVFHFLIGPLIADLTTSDPNEFIAVWCLFSIGLCLSVIKTPIRKHLHVRTWPGYGHRQPLFWPGPTGAPQRNMPGPEN